MDLKKKGFLKNERRSYTLLKGRAQQINKDYVLASL